MPVVKPVDPKTVAQHEQQAPPPQRSPLDFPAGAGEAPEAAPAAPSKPTPSEVELTLPNGARVLLRRPNVATQFIVGQMIEGAFNPYLLSVAKSMLYVAELNGQPIRRPSNRVELQKLMNLLADDGVDVVMNAYLENFLGGGASDLPLSEGQ